MFASLYMECESLPGGLLGEEAALEPELQGVLRLGGQVAQDHHQQQALRELLLCTQLCAETTLKGSAK